MSHLNLNHLNYFWTVARLGSIAQASEQLQVTQPTISVQLRDLERSLGQKLFLKQGRGLELTEMGHVVFRYADDMFSLGRELLETVQGQPSSGPMKFDVGIVNALPKFVAYHLIEPALHLPEKISLTCRLDTLDTLLIELATHKIDLILSDSPMTSAMKVRGYNHLLGESPISVVGTASLAELYRNSFPRCLDGAPFLLPARHTSLRRDLNFWFEQHGVRPQIRAEIDDSALIKVFGQAGQGLFVVPTIIEREICEQFHVTLVGRLQGLKERYYAISAERRLKHPAVVAISNAARAELFRFQDLEFVAGSRLAPYCDPEIPAQATG